MITRGDGGVGGSCKNGYETKLPQTSPSSSQIPEQKGRRLWNHKEDRSDDAATSAKPNVMLVNTIFKGKAYQNSLLPLQRGLSRGQSEPKVLASRMQESTV